VPSDADLEAALSSQPLKVSRKLDGERGFISGSWLLAGVQPGAALGGAAAAMAMLESIGKKIAEHDKKIELVAYQGSHLLTEVSSEKLEGGALFYLQSEQVGAASCCGFFVSERIALTVQHNPIFAGEASPTIFGRSSSMQELQFKLCCANADLDFCVLKLKEGQPDAAAFFMLPSFDSVTGGLNLGLVTMSIGSSTELEDAPRVSQHRVTVTSVDKKYISYDSASTWRGDSGGALLFDEGFVVGLHLEVIDDKPARVSYAPSGGGGGGGGGGGSKRRAAAGGLDFTSIGEALERMSDSASSSAKICCALLLSHPSVRRAVEDASKD
jgi:hypothetical protein